MSYHEEEELLDHRQEVGTPGVLRISAVESGWDVYDRDGDKVGEVSRIEAGSVVVAEGFIFKHDLYVPYDSISGIGDGRVYLNVDKDEMSELGWEHPPSKDTGLSERASQYAHADQAAIEPEAPEMIAIGTEYSTAIPQVDPADDQAGPRTTAEETPDLPPEIALETNRNPLATMYGNNVPPPPLAPSEGPSDTYEGIDYDVVSGRDAVDEAAPQGADVGSTGANTTSDPYGPREPESGQ